MPRALSLSILFHTGLMLIVLFGLPILFPSKNLPEPNVISVELLPIAELTNLRPSKRPPSPQAQQPEPSKKPTPKTVTETPPEPKEKKPDTKPTPKAETKPEPKKEKKPEEPKKAKSEPEVDFHAVLKSVQKEAAAAEADESGKGAGENTAKSDVPYNPDIPLSLSERDAIRGQFVRCWRMPAGARNDYELAVTIKLELFPDGSVKHAELASSQMGRYQSEPFFRAAADSALRAVNHPACNPLKNLPTEKYDTWKDMELHFDPRELLY